MPYSSVDNQDMVTISRTRLHNEHKLELDGITLEMRRRLVHDVTDHFVRTIYIETNPVGEFSMCNIVTHHQKNIWNKYIRKSNKIVQLNVIGMDTQLSQNETTELIKGTKLHRRLTHYREAESDSEIFDRNDDVSDEDYVPTEETTENSDYDDNSSLNMSIPEDLNVSNLGTRSTGTSCIKTILRKLQQIENKHSWKSETVDTLLKKYFGSKAALSKLFMYEMDVINAEVIDSFGKELFKKTDSKTIRINKIFQQLKSIPQLLIYESSDDELHTTYQPKSLREIYWNFIILGKYPKEFLAAVHCNINHSEHVRMWESKCAVDMKLHLPWINCEHTIFNYPEYSHERQQLEMHTFDYTHILNNL